MSGWTKRDPVQNLTILGDGEGDRRKISGLLVDIQQNRLYPEKVDYTLIQQNGDAVILGGSASLGRQIGTGDIGKFLKAEFKGWGKSANGKFKEIEVNVWDGDLTPAMKAWPKYAEVQASLRAAPAPRPVASRVAILPTAHMTDPEPDFGETSTQPFEEDSELPF